MPSLIKTFWFTGFFWVCCGKIAATGFLQYPNHDSISEKIITIRINGVDIEGTLLSSKTGAVNQKLAILIVGSGPTDRNGNSIAGENTDNYKLLAESLASQDIAAFRYDKRGVGKSRPADFDRKDLRFEDYINDVAGIFDYMQDTLAFKDIWLIGHSEGSDIAINASQQRPVKGIISLCGSAGGAGETVVRQIKEQMPSMADQASAIVDTLKQGNLFYNVPQKLARLFAIDAQPYWISWIRHIPSEEIKAVTVPVLIIQGACDVQVTVEEAMKLKAAKPGSKLVIIEKMTHPLKNAKADCKGDDTYTNPALPLNVRLVKEIIDFIGQ